MVKLISVVAAADVRIIVNVAVITVVPRYYILCLILPCLQQPRDRQGNAVPTTTEVTSCAFGVLPARCTRMPPVASIL